MKRLLVLTAAVLSLLAIGAMALIIITSGIVRTADDFLGAARRGDMRGAHGFFSERVRSAFSDSALAVFLARAAVDRMVRTEWSDRSWRWGQGELKGFGLTGDGGRVPLHFSFVRENGDWKIHGLRCGEETTDEDEPHVSAPAMSRYQMLVHDAMHEFALSVNEESMARFRGFISRTWREQYSVARLDSAYRPVTSTLLVDLTILDEMTPIFDAPIRIDEQGRLMLIGHYDTTPRQVRFRQYYVYEGIGWRLVGFDVSIA